jgi:hypothetical protein
MIARASAFSVVAVLVFLAGGTPLSAQSADVDAIKRVVQAESEAFFRRDSTTFKSTWVLDSSAVTTFVSSNQASVMLGWDGPGFTKFMQSNPTPVPIKLAHSNHRVHVDGALAFVEYDETIAFLPDTTVSRFRKHHGLVKRDGEWKQFSKGVYQMSGFDASPLAVEGRLAAIGATLGSAKKHRDAIEVYKLTAQLFPNSPSAYQRLGEGYAAAGETKLAIANYEKSLAMDPRNEMGKAALAKLRASKTP